MVGGSLVMLMGEQDQEEGEGWEGGRPLRLALEMIVLWLHRML